MSDEDENQEDTETVEAIKPMTGSAVMGGSVMRSSGGWWAPPTTISTSTASSWGAKAPSGIKTITLPKRVTKKVLVAFLEPSEGTEDTVVWAAQLYLKDFEVSISNTEQDKTMSLELSLDDIYGTEK